MASATSAAPAGTADRVPDPLRRNLEARLGRGLDDVRLHTGAEGGMVAESLHAEAATIGRDVYFRPERYNPGTRDGRWLLAHEIAHVVQQRGGTTGVAHADGSAVASHRGGSPATALSPAPFGAVQRVDSSDDSLDEALGFDTMLDRLAPIAARSGHPITAQILQLMHGLLRARFVENDQATAVELFRRVHALMNHFRRALNGLDQSARHRMLWFAEQAAISRLLSEIESTARLVVMGAYSAGSERVFLTALSGLERSFIQSLAPPTRAAGQPGPGGAFSRKVFLGAAPAGPVIMLFYLTFGIRHSAQSGAGQATAEVSGSVDESGTVTPSTSAAFPTGEGMEVNVGAAATEQGAEPTVGVKGTGEAGGTTVTSETALSTGGPSASVEVENPDGWKVKVGGDAGGVNYEYTNPAGAGVSFSGTLGAATLSFLVPEVTVGGTAIKAEPSVELRPNAAYFTESLTQRPEAIRAYQRTLALWAVGSAAAALAPAAVYSAAELGAPILLRFPAAAKPLVPLAVP